MTAGSCQSQSIEACTNHASVAAAAPGGDLGLAPDGGPRRRADAARQQQEGEQAGQAQLGGELELERMRVADALVDRALLQPGDAEAARAEAGQRLAAE